MLLLAIAVNFGEALDVLDVVQLLFLRFLLINSMQKQSDIRFIYYQWILSCYRFGFYCDVSFGLRVLGYKYKNKRVNDLNLIYFQGISYVFALATVKSTHNAFSHQHGQFLLISVDMFSNLSILKSLGDQNTFEWNQSNIYRAMPDLVHN